MNPPDQFSQTLPLCSLNSVDVKLAGETVLHQLCWKIEGGEHWSVTGPNGSGKSTFLRLVRGELHPEASDRVNRRVYGLENQPESDPLVTDGAVAMIGPALHEKFQQIDRAITGWEVIASGFEGTVFLQSEIKGPRKQKLNQLQTQPALDILWNKVFQECSQGQQRLLLLARALVSDPTLLLLDEMANGLDQNALQHIHNLLAVWITGNRATISTSHRAGDLAPFVNRFASMKKGRLRVLSRRAISSDTTMVGKAPSQPRSTPKNAPWLELRNVSIYMGNTAVIKNLAWQVVPGEHWAVMGPNGSGKTTLLRTLYGELQPADGSLLKRFGKDSCAWSVRRKRMALFYPSMIHHFDPSERVIDTLRSGFNGCIGRYPRLNAGQREELAAISTMLGLGDFKRRNLHELSYGQTRRVLLARCLLGRPDIILLDEPFDGLDATSHKAVLDILKEYQHNASVIISTHHPEELPSWIENRLEMAGHQ